MIVFRADGNQYIGTGHVMRCMSMALALMEIGERIKFIMADDSMKEMLKLNGIEVYVMGTCYKDMETELDHLNKQLQQEDLLIVDSYFVTKFYLEEISKLCLVTYIDDLLKIPSEIDYLINYNVYARKFQEEICTFVKENALLGVEYVPLRKEFQNVTYEVQKEGSQILITTGGADEYNIAGQLLNYFAEVGAFKSITFEIVVGAFNQHKDDLQKLADKYSNIMLHHNVKNMSALMQSCDVAIAAAGSTLYELCAVGIPTIGLSFVSNQERIGEGMEESGAIKFAGHYHKDGVAVLERAVTYAVSLLGDLDERQRISDYAKTFVDGKGANRIARAIVVWHERGK